MTAILVPVRYPITEMGEKTLRKALELKKQDGSDLLVFNVNLLYEDLRISSKDLQKTVEKRVPEFRDDKSISYSVENSYFLDESILKKIAATKVNAVVMGESMIPRWRKFLKLWSANKISDDIKKAAECKVIVVE